MIHTPQQTSSVPGASEQTIYDTKYSIRFWTDHGQEGSDDICLLQNLSPVPGFVMLHNVFRGDDFEREQQELAAKSTPRTAVLRCASTCRPVQKLRIRRQGIVRTGAIQNGRSDDDVGGFLFFSTFFVR